MNLSMRRVNAIFQKDFKDLSRNSAVSVSALMPLVAAFVLGKMGSTAIEGHYMVINLTMVIVATFVQCSLIAEEKEKNTLRGLMLSPASTLEILGGKSLLSLIATMITVIIGALLSGYRPENVFVITIAILFSTIFFIGLGTLLGLLAKSVMEASVIIMPFMFIFGFGSFFSMFEDKYPIVKVLDYTPNMQLVEIAIKVENGVGLINLLSHFGVIAAWVVLIFILTTVVFNKRMKD
ncbi:ABC transporter permease [Sporosarcina siberiensis]|uniref:ABC transporter permease n=1 Tax=Sporosarcina siberiensis TaxID=1365606 RepID=A0ABW4SED1_9BACL